MTRRTLPPPSSAVNSFDLRARWDTPFPADESETVSLKHPKGPAGRTGDSAATPLFSLETGTIPRHELPVGEMAPDLAYQIVHDELMLDGNARLNVATFVSTWMEPRRRSSWPSASTRT